jgi:hypothetical protein
MLRSRFESGQSYTCARRFEHLSPHNIPGNGLYFRDSCPASIAAGSAEHDEDVIQMNEARRCASREVQRAAPKVAPMIDEPGQSDRPSRVPF